MASSTSTPSRAKKRSPQSSRRKAARSSTARSAVQRTAKPRKAKSAARSSGKRTKPTAEIAPAIRQEWQKLSQRWKSLLPKLTNGSASRSSKKKSAAHA